MFKFIATLVALPFVIISSIIGFVMNIVLLPFKIVGTLVAIVAAPFVFLGLVRKTKPNHKARVRAFVDSVLAKHNAGYDVQVDILWENEYKPAFHVRHARYSIEKAEIVAQEIRSQFTTSKVF